MSFGLHNPLTLNKDGLITMITCYGEKSISLNKQIKASLGDFYSSPQSPASVILLIQFSSLPAVSVLFSHLCPTMGLILFLGYPQYKCPKTAIYNRFSGDVRKYSLTSWHGQQHASIIVSIFGQQQGICDQLLVCPLSLPPSLAHCHQFGLSLSRKLSLSYCLKETSRILQFFFMKRHVFLCLQLQTRLRSEHYAEQLGAHMCTYKQMSETQQKLGGLRLFLIS